MGLIKKVLVANRGEIALRVFKACRESDIATVAVYSDADRKSPHVLAADEAVHLGPSPARESYLNQEKVIAAALAAGADAIHPGYGFLSENADFARLCAENGIVFIGPDTHAMTLMACKASSKALVQGLGIPVIPGYNGEDQSEQALTQAASEIGYPLLIKASAGGGGMGMRVVRSAEEFGSALVSAKQEAFSAFGDQKVLIEKYFQGVRHIELQIVADRHGGIVHCFERECSVQRRRQKVVEEAPSPFMTASLREKMAQAAVAIARAVGYVGAGTVEFIVEDIAGGENFYFLEMNTRLQVEHGVTEAITGLDLVKLQIEIAEGKPLPVTQKEIAICGHAIECRLYAEDPENDFVPANGTVSLWAPGAAKSLRVDAGIAEGTEISPFYDPMLAKFIVHAPDRPRAVRAMCYALKDTQLFGVKTNQSLLLAILDHPDFASGRTNTQFIADRFSELQGVPQPGHWAEAAVVAALAKGLSQKGVDLAKGRTYPILAGDEGYEVYLVRESATRYQARCGSDEYRLDFPFAPEEGARLLTFAVDGHVRTYTVQVREDKVHVHSPRFGNVALTSPSRFSGTSRIGHHGSYHTTMPGRIVGVLVEKGSQVQAGDTLIVMESMKMEHRTRAATDGIVAELFVRVGDVVDAGTALIDITSLTEAEPPLKMESAR